MKAVLLAAIPFLVFAVSCCPEQSGTAEWQKERTRIRFDVLHTRSRIVDGNNFHDSFGVIGHSFTGSWSETLTPDLMYNLEVTKESGWTASCNWPGGKRKARFFAYAPFNGAGISLSAKDEEGSPRLDYSVPLDVASQTDLVAAASGELSNITSEAATLPFRHILTAVQFVCGQDIKAGTVKSIALKGILSKGTYDFQNGGWSCLSDAATFLETLNSAVTSPGDSIAVGEKTFLLLPQVLEDGAEIEVILDDGETEHSLKASIAGSEWIPGDVVVYSISSTSICRNYVFEIPEILPLEHNGGNIELSVSSFVSSSSSEEAVGWSAAFVEEDSDGTYIEVPAPEWISGLASGASGDGNAGIFIEISPQQGVKVNTHNETLRNSPEVPGCFDLSTDGGSAAQRTANCYVVNAPGRYRFPLVYGNGIDFTRFISHGWNIDSRERINDIFRKIGYGSSTLEPYFMKDYINHLGNPLTSPYIAENEGCTPYDAVILWQDAPGLVTEPEIEDGHLTFRVRRESIKQGNAVVAVRDRKGVILWSWHIWVTDRILKNCLVRFGNDTYNYRVDYLSHSLGWCDNDEDFYEGRSATLRFVQEESGLEIIREIRQKPGTKENGGTSPTYQWGRKDPMPPVDDITGTENRTIWLGSGIQTSELHSETWNTGYEAIKRSIIRPDIFNANPNMDGLYVNLWNLASGIPHSDQVIKTIYDPCPPGYSLSKCNMDLFFNMDGLYQASRKSAVWDDDRNGYVVQAYRTSKIKTMFIQNAGYRLSGSGAPAGVGEMGIYWSGDDYFPDTNIGSLNIIASKEELVGFYEGMYSIDKGCACPVIGMVEQKE